jgi:hypothetical protein
MSSSRSTLDNEFSQTPYFDFLKTPFDSKLVAAEGGVLTSFADKGGGSKPGSLESSFSAADLGGFSDFGPSGR